MIEDTPDEMPEPSRWSDSSSQTGTAEHAIGTAFRRVREATLPSDTAVASVGRRLNAEAQPARARLIWRLAIAAALIMATGGAVGAALHRWRRAEAVLPDAVAPGADARSGAARSHRRRRHPATGVVEPAESAEVEVSAEAPPPSEAPGPVAPAPQPAPPVVVAAPPAPARAPVASAPAQVAPSAAEAHRPAREHRAAEEASESVGAAIIADAFRDLRSRGDAAAALQSLDQYDRRFPNGASMAPITKPLTVSNLVCWMALAGSTPLGQAAEHSPTKEHSQIPSDAARTLTRRRCGFSYGTVRRWPAAAQL